jgi:hypothetical protein
LDCANFVKIAVADMENLQMIFQSLGYLVKVLAHCDVYEKLYCERETDSKPQSCLSTSLVNLYISILRYLCHSKRELGRETTGKMRITHLKKNRG